MQEKPEVTPRVTFHKHEVVGAKQTAIIMKRLGFLPHEIEQVSTLVRKHQFRFYEDTKDSTIIKWMQELGKEGWQDMITVRLADRSGNLKNVGKPRYTREIADLVRKCELLIQDKKVIFKEDLQIKEVDFFRYKVPLEKHKELMSNLLAMVTADRKKNQKRVLVEYIRKHYSAGAQNDTNGSTDVGT